MGGASASRRLSGHKTCMPPSGFGDACLQVHHVLIIDIPADTFPLYLKTPSVRLNYGLPFPFQLHLGRPYFQNRCHLEVLNERGVQQMGLGMN